MRNEVATELQEAKERRFLRVKGKNTISLEQAYYDWCKAERQPFVKIMQSRKWCMISLDTITTPYVLSDEGHKSVVEIANFYGVKEGKVGHGRMYCNIEHVPIEKSEELAHELLQLFEREKRPDDTLK